MPAIKRSGAMHTVLMEKRDKVTTNFLKLAEDEENEEFTADLATIMQELCATPHKTKRCKRAVMSNLFDSQLAKDMEESFGTTVRYMYKVPKDFVKGFLPTVAHVKFDTITSWERAARGTLYRVLCRQCQVHLASPNPWLKIDTFSKEMLQRASLVGKIAWKTNSEGVLDWQKTGWFSLRPVCQDASKAEDHQYTKVVLGKKEACNSLVSGASGDGSWPSAPAGQFERGARTHEYSALGLDTVFRVDSAVAIFGSAHSLQVLEMTGLLVGNGRRVV